MRYPTSTGFYQLDAFPGCNQIVISNHAFVDPNERGKGIGGIEHKIRLEHITELGYDYALCTCVKTDIAQLKILQRHARMRLARFYNRETGNWVLLHGLPITHWITP